MSKQMGTTTDSDNCWQPDYNSSNTISTFSNNSTTFNNALITKIFESIESRSPFLLFLGLKAKIPLNQRSAHITKPKHHSLTIKIFMAIKALVIPHYDIERHTQFWEGLGVAVCLWLTPHMMWCFLFPFFQGCRNKNRGSFHFQYTEDCCWILRGGGRVQQGYAHIICSSQFLSQKLPYL